MLNVISLGAGVQSSVMALMAARGELEPTVDACLFADTGGEPESVYSFLSFLEEELPFPVYRVQHKEGLTKAIEDSVANGSRIGNPPLYTNNDGEVGILSRVCTTEYKINPIKKRIREMFGLKRNQRVKEEMRCTQWIGISLDEITRMRVSRDKWIDFRYPLVEQKMRRGDCLEWMKKNGYPEPPRSACVYCPYHDDRAWRKIKMKDQGGWDEAVRIDKLIRGGISGTTASELFLHQSGKPLEDIDFSNDIDRGQLSFLDECDGYCGV